jgi:hypothetical protein
MIRTTLDSNRIVVAITIVTALVLSPLASASLHLTPDGAGLMDGSSPANALKEIATGTQTSQAQIDGAIASFLGSAVELYTHDYPNPESGLFAGAYTTAFSGDPNDATIGYDSGPKILGSTHLLVKDGNSTPAWYLYDVSGWDGMMDIVLSNFWPGPGGAISHVTIYGDPNVTVPEAASMIVWSLLGSIGILYGARKPVRISAS